MLLIKTVNNKVRELEESITCFFLFSIATLVFVAALLRAIGLPQAWMPDLAQLLFGWVIFIGSDIALHYKRHIGVEFFEEKLPKNLRSFITYCWSTLIIFFLGFLGYYGWFLAQRSRRNFDSLVVSELQIIISLGLLFIAILAISFFKNKKKNIKTYLSIFLFIIIIIFYFIFNIDPDNKPEPLNYSFLMISVPVGCLLMARTEILSVINQWRK